MSASEMDDYSGDFYPEYKFDDLSKEALLRLVKEYQKIFQGLCVVSIDELEKELGKDEAQRIYNNIYRLHMHRFAVPRVRKALNIEGNDVMSMFKYFQNAPDGAQEGGMYQFDYIVESKNDMTYIGNYCQNAKWFEKQDDLDGMNRLCAAGPGSYEHSAYEAIAGAFNSKIKMEWPLLPPRKDKKGPFCRWRFYIEEDDSSTEEKEGKE